MAESYDLRLKAPFTMQIVGASGCGKTRLTKDICEHAREIIDPPSERIIFAYSEYQPMYEEMKDVEFVKGLEPSMISRENLRGKRTTLIIDDLVDEIPISFLEALFVKVGHHRNLNIILLVHNLYYKNFRLIALSTHYYCIFRSSRDQSSIATLGRQMFGSKYKYMVEAYEDAVKPNYGYLFIDLKPATNKLLRLRNNILPGKTTTCYNIKDG